MKTLEQNFADWESSVFGYGYGSGEHHIMFVLKWFLELCKQKDTQGVYGYDYESIERNLRPETTWLLINALCHANIIEYGTSPRFGWLTEAGVNLKKFIDDRTTGQLVDAVLADDDEHPRCYPDVCNCSPEELDGAERCSNPFWGHVTVPE